jgi:phosphinothricin acetyltransferase
MIRPVSAHDLERVIAIYNQAITAQFKTGYTTPMVAQERAKWLDTYINGHFPMWVYEVQGLVVGWLSVSPYRQGRAALRYTAEVSYFIDRDYHRQGIASQLLMFAIEACKWQLELKTLLAIVIDRNTASTQLLEKFGFERWGYLPGVAEFNDIECGQVILGLKL